MATAPNNFALHPDPKLAEIWDWHLWPGMLNNAFRFSGRNALDGLNIRILYVTAS